MTTTTVASHWMHHRFVKNLVNASHARDLPGAAKEWRFFRLHATAESLECHLCNIRINNCVTLRNTVNGNYLVCGEDCYDKLLAFLRSGRVKSALPSRDAPTRKLRRHWKGLLRKLKDRTVVGWLREELQAGRLPDDIAAIVYTISRIGLAPTTADADRVIAHYKATRLFTIVTLLGKYSLRDFYHRGLMPTSITINQIERVKAIIDRGRAFANTRYQRRWEADTRRRFTQELASSISKLTALRDQLQTASQAGVTRAAEAVATVERVISKLTSLNYTAYDTRSLQEVGWKIENIVEKTIDAEQWHQMDPETVLFVNQHFHRPYILVKRDNRWQRLSPITFDTVMNSDETGLYTAVVLDHTTPVKVELHEQLDDEKEMPFLDFTVPSKKVPGTFIAMLNGKIVLPSRPIRTPDSYYAFIMNDAGRYYRAWIL